MSSKRKSPSSSSSSSPPHPNAIPFPQLSGVACSVLSCGSGDMSQLGLGSDPQMLERKKPTLIKSLSEENIRYISVGSLHNAVINSNGEVFTWGCNDDSALGHEGDEWTPTHITFNRNQPISNINHNNNNNNNNTGEGIEDITEPRIVQVSCGASHTIALSVDGRVYGWGTYRDSSGVMGFSSSEPIAKFPRLFKGLPPCIQLASGENHSLALTVSGLVYQWGDIGIGVRSSDRTKLSKLSPRLVQFRKSRGVEKPKRIVSVWAGGYGSFAIDQKGIVWAWGPNNYNQCGIQNANKQQLNLLVPTPIVNLPNDSNKSLYNNNNKNNNSNNNSISSPSSPLLPPVKKVAANTHSTMFLSSTGGAVYSVGRGEDGRLGHGNTDNVDTPKKIAAFDRLLSVERDEIVDIAAGEAHSLAVTKGGKLYTWGYGDLLQLGNGEEGDVTEPQRVTSKQLDEEQRTVIQAGGGAQHSLILAYKNE